MIAPSAVLAAATAAGVGLAGGYVYAALSPGSQIFGSTLIADRDPGRIALTFDDGPNDPDTMRLLEVLDKHRVKAVFFMIGRFAQQRPDIVRDVQAAGHAIGNHTMTHPWLVAESHERIRRELANCNCVLEDALGGPVRYFRPPHGARTPYVLRTARSLGLTTVMWNVMGYDWKPENDAGRIRSHVETGIAKNRRAGRGSNIVLHDGGHQRMGMDRGATVQAISGMLAGVPPYTFSRLQEFPYTW